MRQRFALGIPILALVLAACRSQPPQTTVVEIPLIGPTVGATTPVAETEAAPATAASTETSAPSPEASATPSATAPASSETPTEQVPDTLTPTSSVTPATPTVTALASVTVTNTPIPPPSPTPLPAGPGEQFETFASGFTHAVAFDWLPDGRMLVTEKDGRVMLVENGQVNPIPVLTVVAEKDNECGLLGIAVDPGFASNHYVWIYHSTPNPNKGNQIVRFTLDGNQGTDAEVAKFFPRLGGVCGHNGGNLHFGPDGMLYVSIGDNEQPANAQTLGDNHAGKIHRFAPTVPLEIPAGNPFNNSSIYAYGFRNPFDFTFDPASGSMWATENGTYCDDEINRVVPGGNYGWRPEANDACENSKVGNDYPYFRPIINFDSSQAPTGIMFYTGSLFPQWRDRMFFCSFVNKWIRLVDVDAARLGATGMYRIPNDLDHYRCETEISTGPDGAIYFADVGAINRIVPSGS